MGGNKAQIGALIRWYQIICMKLKYKNWWGDRDWGRKTLKKIITETFLNLMKHENFQKEYTKQTSSKINAKTHHCQNDESQG